jgi:hypothetical protein
MSINAPIHIIGGQGGLSFNRNGVSQGRVLERIGVWVDENRIRGVRVWLTGQLPVTFGTAAGPYREYSFQPGERITRLSLWGNGIGTRAGHIRFYTSTGGRFDHGMTRWSLQQEFPINVASGICTGIAGRSGADIDSIGFIFLNPIREGRLESVRYPTLNFDTAGIRPVTLDRYTQHNTSLQERHWNFTRNHTREVTNSWTASLGLEVHMTWTVQAGIPELVNISGEYGWALSATVSTTRTKTSTKSFSWGLSGTLQPGESVNLVAVTQQGRLPSLPYEGIMRVFLTNGSQFTYPVNGIYEGVYFTGVTVEDQSWFAMVGIKPIDAEDIEQPKEGSVQELLREYVIAESLPDVLRESEPIE